MNSIGPKRCFNLGIFGGAISCTLFGYVVLGFVQKPKGLFF